MKKFDVSVVVPVYNTEEYLHTCIESVLLQGDVTVEMICVNDESPDDSLTMLKEFSERYEGFKYINQANTGGATAINNGVAIAQGDYVMILDSDDMLPEETLTTMVSMARKNSSDVVLGKAIRFGDGLGEETVYDTVWIYHDIDKFPENEYSYLYRNGFYNGMLFNRAFLEQHNIRFVDGLLYADRPYMYLCYYHAKNISVLNRTTHYWRRRGESNNLSITDRKNDMKTLSDRVESMEIIRSELLELEGSRAKKHLIYAEHNIGIRPLWHLKHLKLRNILQFYKITQKYYSNVSDESYADYGAHQRLIVRSLNEGWLLRYLLIASAYTLSAKIKHNMKKLINALRKIKVFISKKTEHPNLLPYRLFYKKTFFRYPYKNLYKKLYKQYKSKNMIIFESNFGKIYGGMPKYLYKEIVKTRPTYICIWVYQGRKFDHPDLVNVTQVKRGSLEFYLYLAISGMWINNINFPIFNKRKDVVYLQTWHGTPIKKLGWDINVSGPESTARMRQYYESRNWNYMLAQNDYAAEIFKRAFKVDDVLVEGYPQNDIFYADNRQQISNDVRESLGIDSDKYIIMYAPTWRDTNQVGNWKFKSENAINLEKIISSLPGNVVLLIREHHLVAPEKMSGSLKDRVIDVSLWHDVQELMLISDVLITDYSSIWFDFLNTRRPIIFYLYDHDAYITKIRGLYIDVKNTLPGPIVETQPELIKVINELIEEPDSHAANLLEAQQKYCASDDGQSASRIVDKIIPKY